MTLLSRLDRYCVYASAGLSKLVVAGGSWMNGYTLSYYPLLDGVNHHLPVTLAIAHVHWLRAVCAAVTMAFKLTFVLCVLFPRLSPVYLATGTALHSGIRVLMRPPFFQFIVGGDARVCVGGGESRATVVRGRRVRGARRAWREGGAAAGAVIDFGGSAS